MEKEKVFNYNTNRKKMALPEYGRNIQKMVDHIKTIKNRDERNKAAKTVISVMGNLYPHLRDISDFKHKLWDHLHLMSDFELDIDTPYPKPEKETLISKPNKVPYTKNRIQHLHYGRVVERIIEKAIEIEDEEEKEYLISLTLNHMKKSQLIWNRNVAHDNVIFSDFKRLSGGKLKVPENFQLHSSKELLSKPRRKKKKKK